MNRHLLALVLLAALVPCATSAARAQAATAAPAPDEIGRVAGELLARRYPADGPGGALLIARGDVVLFRAARGEADVDGDVPLQPDSVFRIGSMTKQFAAAGLLKLVEAGKLGLDDPLAQHLPGWPGGERITVLQLLNHTAGVPSYTALPGYMDGPIRQDLTTAQMLDVFRDLPPDFEPGAGWSYSNSGYVLVGAVIEAASGKPWHAWLEEALFEPLGMRHTGYGHDPRFAAQQVHGYSRDGHALQPMQPMSMTQAHAAGALVSTVDDLLAWNRALHEGRVLSETSYARMITPAGEAAAPGIGYGLGLFTATLRGQPFLDHGGHIFGFISSLSYVPGSDITVVILENDDSEDGEEEADALARRLAALALGQPFPEPRAVPVEPATLQAAEGVYRFAGDVVRLLRVVDGKLTAQRGSNPRAPLTPIAPDDFLYPDGFNRLQLERDAGGEVRAMRFFAQGEGGGELGARTDEPLPALPVAVELPRAALERLVGDYASGDVELRIELDGDVPWALLAGQDPVRLRATSATLFEVEEAPASLEFPAGDAPATQVIMRQGGRELVLPRVR